MWKVSKYFLSSPFAADFISKLVFLEIFSWFGQAVRMDLEQVSHEGRVEGPLLHRQAVRFQWDASRGLLILQQLLHSVQWS